MKLYLAGPMRGIPEFNFPAFHAGAAQLREGAYRVLWHQLNDQYEAWLKVGA